MYHLLLLEEYLVLAVKYFDLIAAAYEMLY